LKHGKYAYVKRSDGLYVKVRVFKGRDDNDPLKYIVVGPVVKKAPPRARIINEETLPEPVKKKIYEV